jgi:hypothetical protein
MPVMSETLNDLTLQFQEIAPSLVGMSNALGLQDLSIGIQLEGLKSELANRGVTPQAAKEAIDAATQAAILAKFGGK